MTFFRDKQNNQVVITGNMTYSGNETIQIGNQEFEVNFPVQILVEGNVDGNIKTMSGNVRINGSVQDIKTMSGDVDVRGGVLGKISTMSGDVTTRG